VELAGADSLVARAALKTASGSHQEALHLLDIVLSVDADHAGAKALALQVHQTLLEEAETFCTTGNFWLTGWLQQQISKLRGGSNPPLSF
jgi:alkyl sulfatase BDS1-like metallo-beta-lactamase superfamily hydrolase